MNLADEKWEIQLKLKSERIFLRDVSVAAEGGGAGGDGGDGGGPRGQVSQARWDRSLSVQN